MSLRTFGILSAATLVLPVLIFFKNWRAPIGKISRELFVGNFGRTGWVAGWNEQIFAAIGALVIMLACFAVFWTIINYWLITRRPFSLVPKEKSFIIVENGGKPWMVVGGSESKIIFSKQDFRLKDFLLGQFSKEDQFHFFPSTWIAEEEIKILGGFLLKITARFEARNIGPDYFSKYGNVSHLKEEAMSVISLAAHKVVGEKITLKDQVLSFNLEEIIPALKMDIVERVAKQSHLFNVLGFGINISFSGSTDK